MFLPTTRQELKKAGWGKPDIILVSGDSYIDSPYNGIAVIGKVLLDAGYKVGIICQPEIQSPKDISRLGEPHLFWGVSSGSVDSMVANYTALKKRIKGDDFTPGGRNDKRPDRAVIVYTNLIRRYFKNTCPIVIGGIEASLRRIAHYDYWSDKVRKSILFNAKADFLVYGMGEKTILALALALKEEKGWQDIRGICYIAPEKRAGYLLLPSFDQVADSRELFIKMFEIFYRNNDPLTARGLCQQQDTRYLIQNPPGKYLSRNELDRVHSLNYKRELHPYYKKMGTVRALDTVRFSIQIQRGCYGECNFCAISLHQGRRVRYRSEAGIIKEVKSLVKDKKFKGNISDIGGPTANMYGFECAKRLKSGSCENKKCLHPQICSELKPDLGPLVNLMKKVRRIRGVKKVFVASGIRPDLVMADKKQGAQYLREVVNFHTSGQLKIAPEHTRHKVLELMGKSDGRDLLPFVKKFYQYTRQAKKKQYLTYYLIAAHPGCELKDMVKMREVFKKEIKVLPEQVQVFTPTPSTYSSLMYYTGINPFTGKKIFVEKNLKNKAKQKKIITG